VEDKVIPSGLVSSQSIKHFLEHVCANDSVGSESLFVLDSPAINVKIGLQHQIQQLSVSDSAVQVLATLLARQLSQTPENGMLDLRPYINLTSDQFILLAQALSSLLVRTIDLSHNPNVVSETLQGLEQAFPNMERLALIGCSDISGAEITQLRNEGSFRNVEVIWHTELLLSGISDQQLTEKLDFIVVLCYWKPRDGYGKRSRVDGLTISLPHVLSRTIIPGIIDCITALNSAEHIRESEILTPVRIAFAGQQREFDGPMARRAVGIIPNHTPLPESFTDPCWRFALDFAAKTRCGPYVRPATFVGGFTYVSPNIDDAESELKVLDVEQFLERLGLD
jgi:hypothetical protein